MSVETFKLMVVDEIAPVRHVVIAFLWAGGFAAEHGGSPEEAIDAIRQREFDLALLGIENLSGMYVAEFCHQVRAIGKPIGILLITGTHVYISKPFRTADLISRCQVVVHRVRTRREHLYCR